jgi:hypothetical protein
MLLKHPRYPLQLANPIIIITLSKSAGLVYFLPPALPFPLFCCFFGFFTFFSFMFTISKSAVWLFLSASSLFFRIGLAGQVNCVS